MSWCNWYNSNSRRCRRNVVRIKMEMNNKIYLFIWISKSMSCSFNNYYSISALLQACCSCRAPQYFQQYFTQLIFISVVSEEYFKVFRFSRCWSIQDEIFSTSTSLSFLHFYGIWTVWICWENKTLFWYHQIENFQTKTTKCRWQIN